MGDVVEIYSFSYRKRPLIRDGATVIEFDCRPIRNPHSIYAFRTRDGTDKMVAEYVMGDENAQRMLDRAVRLTRKNVTLKLPTALYFGCVGGRHRSVTLAEMTGQTLSKAGVLVRVSHLALQNPR